MASPASSRKPRVRGKASKAPVSGLEHGSVVRPSDSSASKPAFPLAAFLWPTRGLTSQWVVLPSILMVVGLFKWCTGLWDYSGLSRTLLFRRADSLTYAFGRRLPIAADARGFRGATTLDGNHQPSSYGTMVFPRFGMVGAGLSAIDRIP